MARNPLTVRWIVLVLLVLALAAIAIGLGNDPWGPG